MVHRAANSRTLKKPPRKGGFFLSRLKVKLCITSESTDLHFESGGTGGTGGTGGGWGASGNAGAVAAGVSGGAGGAGGAAVVGNSYITWTTPGTRLGLIS